MEKPMDRWNDDRLDELNRRVDDGFKEMREGFARIEARFEEVATRESVAEVEARLDKTATRESVAEVSARLDRLEGRLDDRFDRLTARIDRFYYTFIVVLVALMANFIANGA